MKKRGLGIITALAGLLLAGTVQAALVETNLNLAATGVNSNGTVITTAMEFNGATFDLNYTLGSTSVSNNPFVSVNAAGTAMGVGSDGDISQHYNTLEGNDGEGMSFTSLSISNFNAGTSGLLVDDISELKFVSLTFGAVANAADGVDISYIEFGSNTVNKALNSGGTGGANPYTLDLTALTNNYPVPPTFATDVYIKCDSGQSNNRWNVGGIGVSFAVDTGANEAPEADAQSITIFPGATTNITLTGSDFEGSNLTYSVNQSGLSGTLIGATNQWTYTPPSPGFVGTDSFTFTVNDGELDSDPATISITVTNEAPTATGQSVDVYTFGSVNFALTGTDTDNGPSNLTYTVLSQPAEGTLVTNGALPNLTYTPTGSYAGEDFFTFSVFDGLDSSSAATVTVTVANNPPVADPQFIVTQPDTSVGITLTGSDLEGSGLDFIVATLPANGDLFGSEPNMTYIPTNGFSGVDSFTYTAFDGQATSAVATVSISVSADGVNLSFVDLNESLSGNTLNLGGIPADVTGVSTNVGALTNEYLYSVVFDGADFDGDSSNDTLTFDVLVEAWSFGTITCSLTNGPGVSSNGTAVVGVTNAAVFIASGTGWAVDNGAMQPGETLQFTVQNIGVSLTDANQAGIGEQTGFFSMLQQEKGASYGHQTVIGVGTGLLESRWNDTGPLSGFDTDADPLYISQATIDGPTANPERWVVGGVDFGISITLRSAAIPPSTIGVSGSDLVISWDGGGTYDVQTNASLLNSGGWGTAAVDETSPVIIPVGSEPVLFFKLSE